MDRLGDDKQMERRQRRSRISRRDFLGATAGAASAIGLAAGGVQASPSPARRASVVRSQAEATLEVWGFNRERLNFAENASKLPASRTSTPTSRSTSASSRSLRCTTSCSRRWSAARAPRTSPRSRSPASPRSSRASAWGSSRSPERLGAEIDNIYKPAATDPGAGTARSTVSATSSTPSSSPTARTCWTGWASRRRSRPGTRSSRPARRSSPTARPRPSPSTTSRFGDWFQMAQHAGTALFDDQGNYQGDNPLSVEAMQFVHDLVYEHQIAGSRPPTPRTTGSAPPTGPPSRRTSSPCSGVRPGTSAGYRSTFRPEGQVDGAEATDRARREQADRELRRYRPVHHRAVARTRTSPGT